MNTYKVIKGTFHVKGYSPDGDSIRFVAQDQSHWDHFEWSSQRERNKKKRQLRIEAIDALETHYEGFRQPGAFAIAALEELLALLKIEVKAYSLSVTKITDAVDGSPGFIATSKLDVYQRPVSFVFPEVDSLQDGDVLNGDELPLQDSINYKLAERGLVYPTFYAGLSEQFIAEFRKITKKARRSGRGLWALDRSQGFVMWDTRTIQEDVIIMPKLFRRFVKFFLNRSDLGGFLKYLKKNKDKLSLYNSPDIISLDQVMQVEGNRFGLTVNPEDLIFKP